MIYVVRSFIMNHYPGKISGDSKIDEYSDSDFEPYSDYESDSDF